MLICWRLWHFSERNGRRVWYPWNRPPLPESDEPAFSWPSGNEDGKTANNSVLEVRKHFKTSCGILSRAHEKLKMPQLILKCDLKEKPMFPTTGQIEKQNAIDNKIVQKTSLGTKNKDTENSKKCAKLLKN